MKDTASQPMALCHNAQAFGLKWRWNDLVCIFAHVSMSDKLILFLWQVISCQSVNSEAVEALKPFLPSIWLVEILQLHLFVNL